MANPRFDARSKMIRHVSLSAGARLLYMLLDDMARDRGNWFVKQTRLAMEIGFSEREVRRQIEELAGGQHLRTERHGTSSTYFLAWGDRTGPSALERSRPDGAVRSDRTGPSALETAHLITVLTGTPKDDRSTVRCACGGYIEGEGGCVFCSHHHGQECDRCQPVDPVEEARAILAGYVARCRLPWGTPDADIATRCLDATGGLVALLAGVIRLQELRREPRQSFGWFPVVLASQRRTA